MRTLDTAIMAFQAIAVIMVMASLAMAQVVVYLVTTAIPGLVFRGHHGYPR